MAGPSIPRGLKDNGDRPLFRRSGPNPDGKDTLSDRIRFYLLEEKETLLFFGMEIKIFSFVKNRFFDFDPKLNDFN